MINLWLHFSIPFFHLCTLFILPFQILRLLHFLAYGDQATEFLCFSPVGCRELLNRTASRMLPGLCNDLRDWLEETRRKAAGLLPIILLQLEVAITQHTQLLITGLAGGVAEALLRVSTAGGGGGSLHLILMSPPRSLPCLADLVVTKRLNSTSSVAPSAETGEALDVLHQLFVASRYVACFVDPKVDFFVPVIDITMY